MQGQETELAEKNHSTIKEGQPELNRTKLWGDRTEKFGTFPEEMLRI